MIYKRFEDLEVWRKSAQLCAKIFLFFNAKKYNELKNQITKSSLSISSNIAEGFERGSDREFIRFLIYAKGSCGELRSQTYIGIKIKYIDKGTGDNWIMDLVEISSMLSGLIKTGRKFLKRDQYRSK
jgi:four helix bundle protein